MIDDAHQEEDARRGAGAPVRGPDGVGQCADRRRGRPDRRPGRRRQGRRHREDGRRDHQQARQVERGAARACRPTPRTRRARASSPGAPYYEVNYPFVYPSAADGGQGLPEEHGLGALSAHASKDKPSRPPLGGINIGVSKLLEDARPGVRGGAVPRQPEHQGDRRREGRPAADDRVGLQRPRRSRRPIPFADLLRESIEAAAPRPVTPAYSDISLAIQKTYSPPDGHRSRTGSSSKLKDRIEKAAEGKIF